MVQIVADADEGEVLFEELAHATGAEQDQSEYHAIALGRGASLSVAACNSGDVYMSGNSYFS